MGAPYSPCVEMGEPSFTSQTAEETWTCVPLYLLPAGKSRRSIVNILPPELFIDIFKNISPEELFVVAQACKLFREVLSNNQQIWRTSRLSFWPHLPLPPPARLNEATYIQLAMLEKGCQFCRKRKQGLKVYWSFQVRCCKDCLADMTISDFRLWSREDIPSTDDVQISTDDDTQISTDDTQISADDTQISTDDTQIYPNICALLPYIVVHGFYGEETRYWTTDVKDALIKYQATPEEYLVNLEDALQMEKLRVFMEDAEIRVAADDEARTRVIEGRKERLDTIIEELSNQMDMSGTPLYDPNILEKCPSYKQEIDLLDQPFTGKDEKLFRQRLAREHENLANEMAIKHRQDDILREIWHLASNTHCCSIDCTNPRHTEKRAKGKSSYHEPLPYTIPTTDSIFDCIDWCPSFTNPPFVNNDPRISWSKEFIIYYLIPELRKEALQVKETIRPLPYWTVKGAAEHKILSMAKVFRCRLCYDNNRVFDYRGVDAHLQNRIHSPGPLDTSEIAEVDVMRALRSICRT